MEVFGIMVLLLVLAHGQAEKNHSTRRCLHRGKVMDERQELSPLLRGNTVIVI